MAIMCLYVQEVKAQTSESGIDWHEYSIAVNDATIQDIYPGHDNSFPASYDYYLYVVDNDGFINAGGQYGAEAVLEAQGLGLHLQRSAENAETIFVRSAMQRSEGGLHANFLGLNGAATGAVNLDRPNNPTKHISFLFELVSGSHNEYRMKINNEENNDEYLTVNTENGAITTTYEETEASKFLLLNTSSVMQAIQDQTEQKQIDVSGLVKNARFLRNIREGIWNWVDGEGNTGTDHYLGMSTELGNSAEYNHWPYCMNNGAFGAMEIGEAHVWQVRPDNYRFEERSLCRQGAGFLLWRWRVHCTPLRRAERPGPPETGSN